jgi:hypothetical protein
MMEMPIVAPAPVVSNHAAVFRDLFDNQCQFRHFQHYLTGLIVLPNKSMANIARCILTSEILTHTIARIRQDAPASLVARSPESPDDAGETFPAFSLV